MFDPIISLIKEWSVAGIFLRLLLATAVGVIIGLDRGYKNKGAGIKNTCIGLPWCGYVHDS